MKQVGLSVLAGLWIGLALAIGPRVTLRVDGLALSALGALVGGLVAFAVTRRAWRGGG